MWPSDAAGEYAFEAVYNGLTSNTVKVTVTAAAAEDMPIGFAAQFVAGGAPDSPIGVFAFGTGGLPWAEAAAGATPNVMHDRTLRKDGDRWTYEPAEYWPQSATDKVSFFAYAPQAAAGNGISVSAASAAGAPVLRYDFAAGGAHTDILTAAPRTDLTRSAEPVSLELRSVMSKIGFRISGSGERVSSIALRGILEKGSVALDAEREGSYMWTPEGDITMTEHPIGLAFDEGQDYLTATDVMTDATAPDGYLYIIPQNFTYNARIVVTVEGDKLGFPIESVAQARPGGEYVIDLAIPGDRPLDYTDNAMPAFLIAPLDEAAAQNISWAEAMAGCPDGYRLPTYNEGLTILFYMNGIADNNFRFSSYWASTAYDADDTQAMGYNIAPWMGLYMPKAGITAARCVRSVPGGPRYPYVDTGDPSGGPVIVSRDAAGGVIPSSYNPLYGTDMAVFHDNWSVTPDHDSGTDADRISRKLQVANADATPEKVVRSAAACPDGWRLPTKMELALIYTAGGAASPAYNTDPSDPLYNPVVTETPLYAVAGFAPLHPDAYWSASMNAGRGYRVPSTWNMVETGRDGVGTMDGPDANYVRCVRDVE